MSLRVDEQLDQIKPKKWRKQNTKVGSGRFFGVLGHLSCTICFPVTAKPRHASNFALHIRQDLLPLAVRALRSRKNPATPDAYQEELT